MVHVIGVPAVENIDGGGTSQVGDQLGGADKGTLPGPDPLDWDQHAIDEGEHGPDRERRPDELLSAANPATLVDVIQRLEDGDELAAWNR